MTTAEKHAFLRSEGWKQRKDSEFGDMIWIDPAGRWDRLHWKTAFLVASRRKIARDTRRLKAAGWVHCGNGCWAHWRKNGLWYRTQAIKTLEGSHEG